PAIVLGLQLADAPVIRNAGGRVTQAVIDDIAYLAFLAGYVFGGEQGLDSLFEGAIVHHTQCGTGLLADPGYRHHAAEANGEAGATLQARASSNRAAEATALAEATLEASAVADPYVTVKADEDRLLTSPSLSPKVS